MQMKAAQPVPCGTHKRSLVMRAIRFLLRVIPYCRVFGPKLGLRWYSARVVARLPLLNSRVSVIQPPTLAYPVSVRMHPSSDEHVFDQLFVRSEYSLVGDRLADQKVILDLGANVGYASAYFATRYPEARILAVEPDPANYQRSLKNLAPYGNRVRVLQGAVWSRCGRLALSRGSFGDGREWATQVVEAEASSEADVDAWDIPRLLDMLQVEFVDLVKIDIEGSEAELFSKNTARWLSRVRNICIELHDERCREIFFRALRDFDYDLAEHLEFTLCTNLRLHNQNAGHMRAAVNQFPVR
jgi:FkbM family methyltransferase